MVQIDDFCDGRQRDSFPVGLLYNVLRLMGLMFTFTHQGAILIDLLLTYLSVVP